MGSSRLFTSRVRPTAHAGGRCDDLPRSACTCTTAQHVVAQAGSCLSRGVELTSALSRRAQVAHTHDAAGLVHYLPGLGVGELESTCKYRGSPGLAGSGVRVPDERTLESAEPARRAVELELVLTRPVAARLGQLRLVSAVRRDGRGHRFVRLGRVAQERPKIMLEVGPGHVGGIAERAPLYLNDSDPHCGQAERRSISDPPPTRFVRRNCPRSTPLRLSRDRAEIGIVEEDAIGDSRRLSGSEGADLGVPTPSVLAGEKLSEVRKRQHPEGVDCRGVRGHGEQRRHEVGLFREFIGRQASVSVVSDLIWILLCPVALTIHGLATRRRRTGVLGVLPTRCESASIAVAARMASRIGLPRSGRGDNPDLVLGVGRDQRYEGQAQPACWPRIGCGRRGHARIVVERFTTLAAVDASHQAAPAAESCLATMQLNGSRCLQRGR